MIKDAVMEKAIDLAEKCRYAEALKLFEVGDSYREEPVATSYYALCVAAVREDYDEALELCAHAAKRELYNPVIYLNAGRIFLAKGRKDLAVKAFTKGLRIDRKHPAILRQIRMLGVRRRPPLPFLPRGNPINKYLGLISYRLGRMKQAGSGR